MTAEVILACQGVEVYYGAARALAGIDIEVRRFETVAIIGANGAGKTTALKAIAGTLTPDSGRILLHGRDLTGHPAYEIAAAGIRLVPEGRQVFASQTVRDNLRMGAFLRYRRGDRDVEDSVTDLLDRFPVLADRKNQLAGYLSGGEQQMLAIARALIGNPEVLLLDEPSTGLAPIIVDQVFDLLDELREEGTTILLVEQLATKALALADRAYVLELGEIVLSGPAEQLAGDPHVEAVYLGGTTVA